MFRQLSFIAIFSLCRGFTVVTGLEVVNNSACVGLCVSLLLVVVTWVLCNIPTQTTGCIKKLNKSEIALRLCKAPQCTKFFIEIGCFGFYNVE